MRRKSLSTSMDRKNKESLDLTYSILIILSIIQKQKIMKNLRKTSVLSSVKTDVQKIKTLKKPKKGSADVVGIRVLGIDPDAIDESLQDSLQWTPKGCFTKNKDVAQELIDSHKGVYIEDNNLS